MNPLAAAFHHHAQEAAWHTYNTLAELGGEVVDPRCDPRIGVVEWWRTIESLVSLLYQVVLIEHERNLRPDLRPPTTRAAKFHKKWAALAYWFSDGRLSPPAKLTGLLTELRDFRNSFEHASRGPAGPRVHSKLATSPAVAHVSDVMEAMAICVAASRYVAPVLPNADLTPEVFLPSHVYALFEPIDIVAEEALFPLLTVLLAARG